MQAPPSWPATQPPIAEPSAVEIFVNARDCYRTGDTYSDVIVNLPRNVLVPEGYSAYVTLTSLSLPNTQLTVNAYTRELVLDGDSYLLPEGNYSAPALATALKAAIPSSYGVSYDSVKLAMTISRPSAFTIGGGALELLGMSAGEGVTSVTSDHTVNLCGATGVFVTTSLGSENVDARAGGCSGMTTMARISQTAGALEVLHYQAGSSPPGVMVHEGSVGSFRMGLEDQQRRPLLTTLPWDASLRVSFVRTGRRSLGSHPRPSDIAW